MFRVQWCCPSPHASDLGGGHWLVLGLSSIRFMGARRQLSVGPWDQTNRVAAAALSNRRPVTRIDLAYPSLLDYYRAISSTSETDEYNISLAPKILNCSDYTSRHRYYVVHTGPSTEGRNAGRHDILYWIPCANSLALPRRMMKYTQSDGNVLVWMIVCCCFTSNMLS